MRQLTKTELRRKSELHPDLQKVAERAREIQDFFYVCGFRDEVNQNYAVLTGASKLPWDQSKHNKSKDPNYKSDAVDVCPLSTVDDKLSLEWKNIDKFYKIYHAFMQASKELGVKIRAGADFNDDGVLNNDKFVDDPHYELA